VKVAKKKRFSASDWLIVGLQEVRQQPPARLTIELLCEKAGRTRGSFYFHFENMKAYFSALGEYWLDEFTLELIRKSEMQPTPTAKLDQLSTLAVHLDPLVDQGMRALGTREEGVRPYCEKVDEARLAYLEKLYRETGKFSDEDAVALATIEYAAMVGYQQIRPNASPKEIFNMYQSFLRLTGRA